MKYIITDIHPHLYVSMILKYFKNIQLKIFLLANIPKYVISKEIYITYKIKIDDCCENHRIYLIDEINVIWVVKILFLLILILNIVINHILLF